MPADRDTRADALLADAARDGGSGRLTVFLGAAPGVGKTWAMLARAKELRAQGREVLVGIVETHGRSETAAMLDGLEVLPRKRVQYTPAVGSTRTLEEFDVDAVLARKPSLVLVDELAHRNVPGSRHERRWQDVIDLLDAGIDVYTTVNIQHLESLNDVVHSITGVRVSETVPDLVFDRLRDIRLVDLPPRELIERLNAGKVYLPEQAAQALQAFFSPSNLAALRELAMQVAADRVDADLRESQAARGLPGHALRRQVLIAIDGLGASEYLVRAGRRIAERRDAPWSVVTVQSGHAADEARQLELDRAFALARSLGATTEVVHGDEIAAGLLDHAERIGASSIVVGRTRERPLARMFNRTLTQRLLQRGARYELVIISTPGARARARRVARFSEDASYWYGALLATFATMAAVAIGWAAQRWMGIDDLSMIFIVAVLLVAARTRMSVAVLAAVLCFGCYNFFFIEPRFTLNIAAHRSLVTVVLFLVAALVAGRLASRLRQQVLALRAANAHATGLQALGRQLAGAADRGQVIAAGRNALARALGVEVWLQLGDDANGTPMPAELDVAAVDWVLRHGQPAGRFTDTLSASRWWLLPVREGEQTHGVAALRFADGAARPGLEQRRLVQAMVDDIAQAASRVHLVSDLERARVGGETERLRSALLSSVSHDLRSPLASMIGSADSLSSYGEAMDGVDRRALLETIVLEGKRLDRYIQNLLDMTRLGHDGLSLNRDWIGVDELVGSAAARLRRYRPQVQLEIDLAHDLPPLWVHPALVEQALFNVLENAAQFSPADAPVRVVARQVPAPAQEDPRDWLRIDIADRGPGIPDDERARIFDMFYSVERGDRGRKGTGLGLTICQGMIGAHGGAVSALRAPDGTGTLIRIELPMQPPPDAEPVHARHD
ncbi:sensor histidine kinase [Luteimonas terrae]|uniref:histidine kinase n=1 Tax=Luteimonas terrae TaxID=1530191 RepID=A0A4R5UDB9_9GAMM|nr:sensor histidine kinase KdpD [Luteimonas terrae]TDK33287.1 sensor histidine kinase KdpD [Luteimonas terrae]